MKRISALLAVLLGLSLGAMAQEPDIKKSAAQENDGSGGKGA